MGIFRVSTMDDRNAVSELNVVDLASMYGNLNGETLFQLQTHPNDGEEQSSSKSSRNLGEV